MEKHKMNIIFLLYIYDKDKESSQRKGVWSKKKTDIKINITIFEIFLYSNKDTILTKIPKVKIQIINNMIFAIWKSKYHYF